MERLKAELASIVGPSHVRSSAADRLVYSVDVFWVPQMWIDRGLRPPLPDVIVYPGSVEEVSAILRLAHERRIPVVPYGGGSGSQGGTLPVFGGIMLDLKRMNRIVDINTHSLTVTAEAGINGHLLEEELNRHGITLAHYPASARAATLGGYLAARGSGTLSTKYGKAEEMVMSIRVVLAGGRVFDTLPVPRHASGPGLMELFIGSEGTLGVIVQATMRCEPLPEERRFQALLFKNLPDGLEAGRRIMTRRLRPAVIRLYDDLSTKRWVKSVLGLDVSGNYMVMGFDGPRELVEVEERLALDICREAGAIELGPEAGWAWWNHRYDFYFPPKVKALPKLFGTIETVTTYDHILPLYTRKKRELESKYAPYGLSYFGHFSHWYPWGVMVYDQFIIDHPPEDAMEALRLHNQVWEDAARLSLAYGGVLNEHHGIGLKLSALMPEQYGEAWPVLQAIKQALDPHGIMNPGKLGLGGDGWQAWKARAEYRAPARG